MDIRELLDRAKNMANIESDYMLAKALGVSNGYISEYRKGKRHPSIEIAVQLATLAKLEDMRVIAEIELRTANTEKKRKFWKCYLEDRGIAAVLTMITLAFSIAITPEPAEANTLQLQNYGAHFHNHNEIGIYIMRISGRGKAERFAERFRV